MILLSGGCTRVEPLWRNLSTTGTDLVWPYSEPLSHIYMLTFWASPKNKSESRFLCSPFLRIPQVFRSMINRVCFEVQPIVQAEERNCYARTPSWSDGSIIGCHLYTQSGCEQRSLPLQVKALECDSFLEFFATEPKYTRTSNREHQT